LPSHTPRKYLLEQCRELADRSARYVDISLQLRVWFRAEDDSRSLPGDLLPAVYGGRFDTWTGHYVGPAEEVAEFPCHAGQVPLLTFDDSAVWRVLAKGAPGGGKTEAVALKGLIEAVRLPKRIGGMVAPSAGDVRKLWKKFWSLANPRGWIRSHNKSEKEITLVNGTLLQFRGAKSSGDATGSPIKGEDWDFCCEDEMQNIPDESIVEVNFRGRRAGKNFRVYSAATYELIPWFENRLDAWESDPLYRVLSFSGYDNAFVERAWWDRLKSTLDPETFARRVMGLDPPRSNAIYPRFSRESVRSIPPGCRDVTPAVIATEFVNARGRQFLVGTDFGSRTCASAILKCYQEPGCDERAWWVVDEVVSDDGEGTDLHAEELIARGYAPDRCLVIGDPHVWGSIKVDVAEKSDYTIMRAAGFKDVAKASSKPIYRKHRFSMINALLQDTNGKRRLFLLPGPDGKRAKARRVADSFKVYHYDKDSEPLQFNKDHRDMSHYTDAVGYALWRFERFRGDGGLSTMKYKV